MTKPSPTPDPPIHPADALRTLAGLDLNTSLLLRYLARELNHFTDVLLGQGGRSHFTTTDLKTLFWRMHDIAMVAPKEDVGERPVDLDEKALEAKIVDPKNNVVKLT
jgi:hypothetical protein